MCTDLLIGVPEDGVVVNARTMEFAANLNSTLKYHPAGKEFNNAPGKPWHSKYNYVSIDGVIKKEIFGKEHQLEATTDGLNEHGFSAGALWFKGFAHFDPIPTEGAVNMARFVDYLLGNYTRVQDVLDDINSKKLKVWGLEIESNLAPIHFPIHDSTGATGILEFTKEKTVAMLNHSHTCTNSPGIDWHLNNLGYYASLTVKAPTIKIGDVTYPVEGMGAGLRGIPGDSFPASRFVRAFYTTRFSVDHAKPKTAQEAVVLASHLMNAVDIAHGESEDFDSVKKEIKDAILHKKPAFDYTQWVAIKDLVNCKLYYRTYDSMGYVVVDLKTANFSSPSVLLADIPAVPVNSVHHK